MHRLINDDELHRMEGDLSRYLEYLRWIAIGRTLFGDDLKVLDVETEDYYDDETTTPRVASVSGLDAEGRNLPVRIDGLSHYYEYPIEDDFAEKCRSLEDTIRRGYGLGYQDFLDEDDRWRFDEILSSVVNYQLNVPQYEYTFIVGNPPVDRPRLYVKENTDVPEN